MLQRQVNKEKMKCNIKGFTFIEVLLGMAIFSIGILAVAAMQMTATNANASARRITEATALAETQIENLMQLSYDHADLNPGTNPHEITRGPYTVNWNVIDIDLDSDGTNDSKTVDVSVSYRYGTVRNVSMQYIILNY
jgi:type IV pilus assembly protein PilV